MPNNTGRTSSTFLLGSQKVTFREPENEIGWVFGYYCFHAELQRKFWLMVRNNDKNASVIFISSTLGTTKNMEASRPQVEAHCFAGA